MDRRKTKQEYIALSLASEVLVFLEQEDFAPPAIDTWRRTYVITIPSGIFVECIYPARDVSVTKQALDEGSISSKCAPLCNGPSYRQTGSSNAIFAPRAHTFN